MPPRPRLEQSKVIAWLREGGAWQAAPDVAETHAALVFMIGDRAFKMKKAVDLGYLDFSTLERRRATLERELTLNRRTAASLYLGVRPVCEDGGGKISLDGEGEPIEWLLEMRRFPEGALLSAMADRGALTEDVVRRLAARIASFHEQEEVVPHYDWPASVARIASENAMDLRSQSDVFGGQAVDAVIAQREQMRQACASQLILQSGDVRHCHGDLHLRNAFLDHDEPTLFDCIEFNDFYALIPPLYDLAFLLMDLEARRLPHLANAALNSWWLERGQARWDPGMRSLRALPLYLSLRAEISAKTMALVPAQLPRARDYLKLAQNLKADTPRLVAIGGLSGTGKSSLGRTIAGDIGARPGAIHLRSDQIRKRLAGVGDDQRLTSSTYTAQASDRVYEHMFALAGSALEAGHSVILDAVFAREAERERAARVARESHAAFAGFWLEARTTMLEQRLNARRGDASDADVEVLRKQLTYDLGRIDWHRVNAQPDANEVSKTVRDLLRLRRDDEA